MSDNLDISLKSRNSSILNSTKNKVINSCFFIKKGTTSILKRYQSLAMHLKVAIAAGVGIILLIVVVAIFSGHRHKTSSSVVAQETPMVAVNLTKQSVSTTPGSSGSYGINDDLTDLQAKLANIEKMLSSHHSVVNIDKVRADIHSLNQEITQIEQDNKAQYSALRSQIASLSSQLESYQKTTANKLDEIEAIKNKVKCLSSSHLPFTVQSIDMVNGRNVVSVLYANMVSPLENDFTLAGWKLSSSDYEHQTARFVNRKGVCASVNLNGSF